MALIDVDRAMNQRVFQPRGMSAIQPARRVGNENSGGCPKIFVCNDRAA
jgi:hypothetical protein